MSASPLFSLHFLWLLLVLVNFIIQLAYYYRDNSRVLLLAKKTTTPLLLFFGLFIVVIQSGTLNLIPCIILAAMGAGELGIEGSSVVESKEGDTKTGENTPVTVILAGVLFLLVNIFIGIYLIIQGNSITSLILNSFISILIITLMLAFIIRTFNPHPAIRTQMIIYSVGLAILMTGFLSDFTRGLSPLGQAAAILTVSDSLVLIRMGAHFSKSTAAGFRILLAFLVVILVLYYFYMGLLINMGSPFILFSSGAR